jgi:NADPH-dependent 2,4-dienoyl-CoA reductase/sulfur reductase-like enzyme
MPPEKYQYIIVGGGLAAASAVTGIREKDREGSIGLFGAEEHLPYDRPPLSKKLWFGKMTEAEVFLNPREFYAEKAVDLNLGTTVTAVNPGRKTITFGSGQTCGYEKLLLATGGRPRRLPIDGGDLAGLCYYRTLDDYRRIRAGAREGQTALVAGGGFIGSEIAAALTLNQVKVTMIFPEKYLGERIFPGPFGRAVQEYYREKGVAVIPEDKPVSFFYQDGKFTARTGKGRLLSADLMLVGAGILPETGLAEAAGLPVNDGILVDEFLQASTSGIYAAGDNARFPCRALGKNIRLEHWDNALHQGRLAGRNMAGAAEPYWYLPYFFSDLFELGYEAVGEVDSRLPALADWQEENRKGVIYYTDKDTVRGVLLCNVWGKVDRARDLIEKGAPARNLAGLIR